MEPKIQKISYESQSSSQMVASIDDLLIQIILLLPMKSLIRFKSVSKHWQSLISNPGFSVLRNPNPNPATGIILQVPVTLQLRPKSDPCSASKPAPFAYVVSFDTSPQIRTVNLIDPNYATAIIKGSCNGLILMCGRYKTHFSGYDSYVCNPTTNTFCKLPQMPDPWHTWIMLPMCLAFDPSKSLYYKVISAMSPAPYCTRYQIMVYSSETGCWRKSCVEPFEAANVDFQGGVYWNGAIHWVSETNTGKSIYFDPDDDRMSLEIMPTPRILYNNTSPYYYFGESCGHLHYIDNCSSWVLTKFVVYELRRDYSEWFVKYIIDRHDPYYPFVKIPCVLAVVRGKREDDSFSVLLIGGKLVRYNFLNKTRETICKVAGASFEQCFDNGHDYLPLQHAESLCSV